VFCWGDGRGFRVIESRTFRREAPDCRFATQSGPMLVIGGALHPRFLPDSDSPISATAWASAPTAAARSLRSRTTR
jgi:uncharacterized protein YigE (DUF2233 family)